MNKHILSSSWTSGACIAPHAFQQFVETLLGKVLVGEISRDSLVAWFLVSEKGGSSWQAHLCDEASLEELRGKYPLLRSALAGQALDDYLAERAAELKGILTARAREVS